MKALSLTTLLALGLMAANASAATLPDGKFNGHGIWKSADKSRGNYEVTTEIAGSSIKTKYTQPDGTVKTWDFEMTTEADGFFAIMSSGARIGEGYCLEQADVCHYELSVGDLELEETLSGFEAGKLYKLGSKAVGGGARIMWQEALVKE